MAKVNDKFINDVLRRAEQGQRKRVEQERRQRVEQDRRRMEAARLERLERAEQKWRRVNAARLAAIEERYLKPDWAQRPIATMTLTPHPNDKGRKPLRSPAGPAADKGRKWGGFFPGVSKLGGGDSERLDGVAPTPISGHFSTPIDTVLVQQPCGPTQARPHQGFIEGIALIVIQTTLRANASRTAAQAASRRRARLSDRLPTGRAAALSHRKSPDRPMCSQPTGEVWVSHSSGTTPPVARRCTTASAI